MLCAAVQMPHGAAALHFTWCCSLAPDDDGRWAARYEGRGLVWRHCASLVCLIEGVGRCGSPGWRCGCRCSCLSLIARDEVKSLACNSVILHRLAIEGAEQPSSRPTRQTPSSWAQLHLQEQRTLQTQMAAFLPAALSAPSDCQLPRAHAHASPPLSASVLHRVTLQTCLVSACPNA